MPTEVTIAKLAETGIKVTLPDGSQAKFSREGEPLICDVISNPDSTIIKRPEVTRTIRRESKWLTPHAELFVTVRRVNS